MTERREFLGAMLAVFCGIAVPQEAIRVIRPVFLPGDYGIVGGAGRERLMRGYF